ncbi:MAG: response regulator transcription factor [Chitinophagaceae bacterium]|nr:response regulator transcription factor [Chitinophagaceae bacterium]
MPVRIIIFEDNADLRQSIKILLNGEDSYEVVGDFDNCENAAQIVRDLNPDIVLMDIDMPKVNGIEGLRIIKEVKPDTAIIMHTVFEDDQRLFDSLCAGANGYLLKNSSFVHLLEAIEEVRNGGAPISSPIAKKVLQYFQHKSVSKNKYDLSSREKTVLQYLVRGYSYKMIAAAMFVSLATVQSHIRNIYTKLHVNCGREAVVIALRDKIV